MAWRRGQRHDDLREPSRRIGAVADLQAHAAGVDLGQYGSRRTLISEVLLRVAEGARQLAELHGAELLQTRCNRDRHGRQSSRLDRRTSCAGRSQGVVQLARRGRHNWRLAVQLGATVFGESGIPLLHQRLRRSSVQSIIGATDKRHGEKLVFTRPCRLSTTDQYQPVCKESAHEVHRRYMLGV